MEEIYFPKYFNDWLNRLNNEQREKFWFLNDVAIIKSQTRMDDLLERYNLRSSFVSLKGKSYKESANDEVVKASEELTRTDLSPNWLKIHAELLYIQDKIKKAKTENQDFFYIDHEEKMDLFFWEIVNQDGLIFDYLNQEFDYENTDESEFVVKSLRDFDKIVDFMGKFRWLVELLNIVEDESYLTRVKNPKKGLTFKQLFKPEHRDKIPDEVVKLLGQGQADAWKEINGKMEWVYDGPESAIMIPFYFLCEKKYIEIPSRKIKDFIKVWLQEFGKEYKSKTFDKPPQDYEAIEYFKEYLNKLK